MNLDPAQLDRAHGVLVATAAGDALGAGYEFGPPLPAGAPVAMTGGGHFRWAPGEWTDDTSMALAIAETAAAGPDLRTVTAQDAITARWAAWARGAKDVGTQTRHVLHAVRRGTAAEALAASRELHQRTGHTAGNGSLMRTAPVQALSPDDFRRRSRPRRSRRKSSPVPADALVTFTGAPRPASLRSSR